MNTGSAAPNPCLVRILTPWKLADPAKTDARWHAAHGRSWRAADGGFRRAGMAPAFSRKIERRDGEPSQSGPMTEQVRDVARIGHAELLTTEPERSLDFF